MAKLRRDQSELYYEVHGEGPVVLLTHGYSATSQMWRGQIEPFSKHFKLVVWDMRGHGHSDYPEDLGAYSEAADGGRYGRAPRLGGRAEGDHRRPVPRRLHEPRPSTSPTPSASRRS